MLAKSYEQHLNMAMVRPEEVADFDAALEALRKAERDWFETPAAILDGKSPAQAVAEVQDPEALRELLVAWCKRVERDSVPEPFRQAVVERANDLVPVLLAMVEDGGPGAALALQVLAEGRVEAAVPAMLAILEQADPLSALADAVVHALREIGEPARAGLYAMCERYKANVDSDAYCSALEVLVHLPQDDRTWGYLRQALEESRVYVGLYGALAGDYGDKRAVYFLNAILEEQHLSRHDQETLVESLELCGGVLTPRAEMRMQLRPRPQLPDGKPGRNDPCPCGSGKKYKKCCGQ